MDPKASQPAGSALARSFVETPYEDQTWEIVGERVESDDFEPMEFETLQTTVVANDPMFEDYGGRSDSDSTRRWHLPEHLAHAPEKARREAEEAAAPQIAMVPEADVERLCAEAFERGKQEALAQAQGEYTQKVAEMAGQVETLLQDLQAQLNAELASMERHSVALAAQVAEKIVGAAVEINPEYIVPVINEALTLAKGAAVRKVRVSPQDMEFIDVVGISKHLRGFDGTWNFESDATIKSGCVVETSAGEIDFQLDRAWARIQDAVVKAAR